MANDTRSTRKVKDDGSNSSGRKLIDGQGLSTSGFGTSDASSLRRSSRETSSRKQTSSPSSTRKSERLEKQAPKTSPVKKQFERVQKHKTPRPLKRSDKGKKHTSSSSSGSKKSERISSSSDMVQKVKKQKSVRQLMVEARKVNESKKLDSIPDGRKRKTMDARTYKSLFKRHRKDTAPGPIEVDEELERPNKLSQVDKLSEECDEITSGVAVEPSNSSIRDFGAERQGNHVEVELSCSSWKHSCTEESYKPSDGDGIKASKSGDLVKETVVDAKKVLINDDGDIDRGCGSTDIRSNRRMSQVDKLSEECDEIASGVAVEPSNSSIRDFGEERLGNHVEVELSVAGWKHSSTEESYKPSDGDGIEASKSGDLVKETVVDCKKVLVNDGDIDRGCGSTNIQSYRRMSQVDKLSEECDKIASGVAVEPSNSSIRDFVAERLGNHVEVEFSCSSWKHSSTEESYKPSDADGMEACKSGDLVKETLVDAKKVLVNDGDIDRICGSTDIQSNRRKHPTNKDFDASMVPSQDICTSDSEAVSSPSSGCKKLVELCVACSKRLSVDHDSAKVDLCSCNIKSNKDLCGTSFHQDRRELEAGATIEIAEKCDHSTPLKETPLDVEMDGHENVCVICKLGGKLLCCDGKGCKGSYHLSCLDPQLADVPPGIWHCFWCVKKKIESGVYSVSEGVESIWDTREVKVSDAQGLQRQKQYFVKYRGLAHIHNQWIPETQLLLEAPLLVVKFNQKNEDMRWNSEWTVPHRLLKKRMLVFPKEQHQYHSGQAGDFSDDHYEWLVKWCGLDYKHATWELDNVSFLRLPRGRDLVREYENRREKAKRASVVVDKTKKQSQIELPAGGSPEIDSNQLNSVKKLCENWHKGQNAVVIDGQEQVMKVILFIRSLSDVYQPFLVITTSNALSTWEAEFLRLAPSVDVVVYNGNRDTRRSIRTLEFYEDGGCPMFQVLLSPPEAVVEDIEILKFLRWEAVIVDECQCQRISLHFEQFKMLDTDIRLLLFNGQINDSIAEYLNLLSLLDSCGDLECNEVSKSESDNIGKLKERLSQFIAYDCKTDSSRFVEFWVPVQISNMQLEQYCATLLSNCIPLSSGSKNDPVGALRDILISTRKCCDHPYILDPSLILLTKGLSEVDLLDFGIKASGKLQFLDAIVSEMKNRHLRVLIFFQSIGGSGKNSIGDILDDFLRHRFGQDSYERVDACLVVPSKRQAALNNFNKEGERFVFLLENRACLPSIKLSSVDAIIIYDSDWNPANDLRALHRISIESRFEPIMIFRLYSSCTVEEKIQINAKLDLTLDSYLQNVSRSTSDMLLMWGASYLFNRLDEFHSDSNPASCSTSSPEQSLLHDTVKEVLAVLSQNGNGTDLSNSIIWKVQDNGGTYRKKFPLLGELKIQLTDAEPPNVFWKKLLNGRNPPWKYSSLPTQRSRKRVQYCDQLTDEPEVETGEIVKKRKKLVSNYVDPTSLKPGVEEGVDDKDKGATSGIPANKGSQSLTRPSGVTETLHSNSACRPLLSCVNSLLADVDMVQSEERRTLSDAQRSLHILLEPEISKLCEILKLSEEIKLKANNFLKYVLENHRVCREPARILQAFQISVCWIAASLLKHKIDKKESIVLAKLHLGFSCKDEEANSVYSMLRVLKKMFLSFTDNLKESDSSKDHVSAADDITKEPLNACESQSGAFNMQNLKVDIEEGSQDRQFADVLALSQTTEQASKCTMDKEKIPKSFRRVQRKCEKRMKKLLRKQDVEIQEFHRFWEEKRLQLEKEHRVETALIRSIHRNSSIKMNKLKILDNDFAKKMEEHNNQEDICFKDLEAKHLAAREEEKQKATNWSVEMKSCTNEDGILDELHLHRSEYSQSTEHIADNGPENDAHVPEHLSEQIPDRIVHTTQVSQVAPADIRKTVPNKALGCSIPAESTSIPVNPNYACNDDVETMAMGRASSFGRIEQHNRIGSSSNSRENTVSGNSPSSEEQAPDGVPSVVIGLAVPSKVPATVCYQKVAVDSVGSPVVVSDGENERGNEISSDVSNALEILSDGTNGSFNAVSPFLEPSLVDLPSVQPVVSPACDELLPQYLALDDEFSQALTNIEIRDALRGNQSTSLQDGVPSLQPVDPGHVDQSNHEAPLVEPLDRIQQSQGTSDIHVGQNQLNLPPTNELARELCIEGHISVQNAGLSFQLAGNHAEISDQAASQTWSICEVDSPIDVAQLPLGNNQPDLISAGSVQNQQSDELQASFQNAEDPPLVFEARAELTDRSVLQPEPNLSVLQELNNFHPHNAHQVASQMPTVPLYADPLQNELDRLRKETEQAIKVHEDTKVRLKSECDKEIEEITAQIRRKYETKYQEAVAAFSLKKNEIETYHNKVLMNKILAEAFRSKCLDLRPTGAVGMPQATHPGLLQQRHQLPLQPTPRPPAPGLHPVGQPGASQQITPPPSHVNHSAALFSSSTTRPPLISPITPSTLRAGGEIRTPAPHIQPFRPASMSTASFMSLPRGIPSQQAPNNIPPTHHQLTPQPPPPPTLPLPTNHSGPYSRSGGFPRLNSSYSALKLFMDIDSRLTGHQPNNNVPPLPNFSTNFDSLDLNEFGAPDALLVSSAPSSAVAADVVCLSDDD